MVKSAETLALDVMRSIQSAIHQENVHTLTATVPPAVGFFLLNRKRAALTLLEEELSKRIIIAMGENQAWDQYSLEALDERATVVKLEGVDFPSVPKSHR